MPLNLHRTYAQSPEVFAAYATLARTLRSASTVPRPLREIAIIRTLQLNGGAYELAQHRPMALACGVSGEQIVQIQDWRKSALFDAEQRAVLAYVEAMSSGDVSDEIFGNLARCFDSREIVDLTLTISFYTGDAHAARALAIPLDAPRGPHAVQYGVR